MSAIGILVLCTGLLLEMSPRQGLVVADIDDRAMRVPEPDQDYIEGTSNKTEPELGARKIQGPIEPSGLASQETIRPQRTEFLETIPSSTLTPATQHPVEEPSGAEPLTGSPLSAEIIDSDLPKVTEARRDTKAYDIKFDEILGTTKTSLRNLTDTNPGLQVNQHHAMPRVLSIILPHVINLFTRARRLASRSFWTPLESGGQTRGELLLGDDRQSSGSSDGQNQDTMSQSNLSRYETISGGSDARGNDSGGKLEENLPRFDDYTNSNNGQKHDQIGEPQSSSIAFNESRKKENDPHKTQSGEGMSRSSDYNNKGDSSTYGRIYLSRLSDHDVTFGKSGANENYFKRTQSAEKISRLRNYNNINDGLVKGRKFLVGPISGGSSYGSDSLGTKKSVIPSVSDTNKWLTNLPVGREMTSPEIFSFKEDEGQRAEASGRKRVRRDSLNMPVGIIPQTRVIPQELKGVIPQALIENIPQSRKYFIPEILESKIPEAPKQATHQTPREMIHPTPKDMTPPTPREVTSSTQRQKISQTPTPTIAQKPKEIIPPTQKEKHPQKPKEVLFQPPKEVPTKTSNGSITQTPLEVIPQSQKEITTTWKPVEFTFNPIDNNDDDDGSGVCNGTMAFETFKATPEEKKKMEETEKKKQEEKKKEVEEKRRTISQSPKEAETTWTPIEFEFNPNGDDDKGCDGKELTPEQKKKREEKKKKKEEEEKKKKEEEKKKEQEEKKKEEEEKKKEKEEELEEQKREKAEELEEQKREREEELEEQRREREEELEEQKREREEADEERRREEAEREKEESWQDDDDGFRFMNPNFS